VRCVNRPNSAVSVVFNPRSAMTCRASSLVVVGPFRNFVAARRNIVAVQASFTARFSAMKVGLGSNVRVPGREGEGPESAPSRR
jgi:hypothetical protein